MIANCVLQTARHEREQADKKIAQLTAEVSELEKRLVEMRATEVERMNNINHDCEEMVCKGCMLCNWLQCTRCCAIGCNAPGPVQLAAINLVLCLAFEKDLRFCLSQDSHNMIWTRAHICYMGISCPFSRLLWKQCLPQSDTRFLLGSAQRIPHARQSKSSYCWLHPCS